MTSFEHSFYWKSWHHNWHRRNWWSS